MSKRLIALLLTASIVLTGTSAFAADTKREQISEKISTKVETIRENREELKPLVETVKTNRTQLVQLRAEVRKEYNTAKNNVKELLKDKENLTPEQIEALKQALKTLAQDRDVIEESIGDIEKECIDLRQARRDKDIEAHKEALNNIITIQNSRIENLKKTIDDMKKISEI